MRGQILHDILSGKVEEDPALLLRFLVISFADLKNWKIYYNVAFPSLVFNSTLLSLQVASTVLSNEEVMFMCTYYSCLIHPIGTESCLFFPAGKILGYSIARVARFC